VRDSDGAERKATLRWLDPSDIALRFVDADTGVVKTDVTSGVRCELAHTDGVLLASTYFNTANQYRFDHEGDRVPSNVREARLVDGLHGQNQRLDQVYARVVREGRKDHLRPLLAGVLGDDFADIEPLPEADERWLVNLRYRQRSIPVALAGDGVHTLVRLCLELAAPPGDLLLLEEPELHQHPRSIWKTAEAIWSCAQRDAQVVLTTHSLEVIDALIGASNHGDLTDLTIFRLRLADGQFSAVRIPGPKAATRRGEYEDDLR